MLDKPRGCAGDEGLQSHPNSVFLQFLSSVLRPVVEGATGVTWLFSVQEVQERAMSLAIGGAGSQVAVVFRPQQQEITLADSSVVKTTKLVAETKVQPTAAPTQVEDVSSEIHNSILADRSALEASRYQVLGHGAPTLQPNDDSANAHRS